MERHPTDFIELLFGLGFLATGASFIVDQTTDRVFDPAWIAAIALVGIGGAFLAVTLLHRPRREPAAVDAAAEEPIPEEPMIEEPAP
jgi:flagellar biosynthesis/type III secretory pathway M-ring protein FliF/YscJ